MAFFSTDPWNPDHQDWGIWPLLITSLCLTIGSVGLATPLGILLAYYQLAYAHPYVARFLQGLLDIASGVPSVVYGFWGLTFLVPALAHFSETGQGQGLLAGCLLLSLILTPIAAIVARNSLQAVPKDLHIAGHALGLKKSSIWIKLILPAAKKGIFSGIIIQTTRALGETMAILMVCGNVINLPLEPFLSVKALTANIARDMGEADDLHRSALFATGLFLLFAIFILMVIQRFSEKNITGAYAKLS